MCAYESLISLYPLAVTVGSLCSGLLLTHTLADPTAGNNANELVLAIYTHHMYLSAIYQMKLTRTFVLTVLKG